MELEHLLFDSTRRTAGIAVNIIGKDPKLFKRMLDFALEDKDPFALRAARVVNIVTSKYPWLIQPYLKNLVLQLKEFKSIGLKRGIAKTLAEGSFDYDEETFGMLVDTCFFWFNHSSEEIAVRIYALEIVFKASGKYPEIKPELVSSIENEIPRSSAAIKSRGKRLLKILNREIQ